MPLIYRCIGPAGKSYVGQTVLTLRIRKRRHIRDALREEDGHCRLLSRAMKKHGINNFKWEVLVECNEEHLDLFEVKFIAAYKTLSPHGYNLTTGGNAKKHLSDETKDLLREKQLKHYDSKFPDHPAVDLPKYIIRWRRSDEHNGVKYEYKGYAVHGHPKCKHKFFGGNDLTEALQNAKTYLQDLDAGKIEPSQKEELPEFIHRRRGGTRDGYEVRYKDTKRRFTSTKMSMAQKLQTAIEWLETQKNSMQLNA